MAKGKGGKRGKRPLTPKQRAALKKGQAALKRWREQHYGKKGRSRAREAAAEKLPGGRIRVKQTTVHPKKKNVGVKGYTRHVKKNSWRRESYTYKQSPKQRAASLRNLAIARRARKGGTPGYAGLGHHPGAKRLGKRSARENPIGIASEMMAVPNPVSTVEGFLGAFVATFGYLVALGADRVVATHAVQAAKGPDGQPVKNANGIVVYDDQPGVGQQYNVVVVDAPMGLWRQLTGAGLMVAPFVVAMIPAIGPTGKTTLRIFGFGTTVHYLGKNGKDALAWLLRKMGIGQQLFAPEINAQQDKKKLAEVMKTNDKFQAPAAPAIPSAAGTGVGRAPATGCGKANCAGTGVGGCGCSKPVTGTQAAPTPPAMPEPEKPAPQMAPPSTGTMVPSPARPTPVTGTAGVPLIASRFRAVA